MAEVNLGLIGAGRIGRVHAHNLCSSVRSAALTGIADVNLSAAVGLSHECGDVSVYPSTDELLADSSIDAVVIACATNQHAPTILAAAQAGKHIFCEKPIATNLGEIDEAISAVEQAGVVLQVGFNRRFDANVERVRRAVTSGEIGQPHLLHIISRDPAPPPLDYIKVSGGIFMDMSIHDFDMARFLVGHEIEEVFVHGAVLIDEEIGRAGDIDTALISLKFANGALGMIDNSRRAAYGYDQRIELMGDSGSIRTQNVSANNTIISDVHGIHVELPLHFFLERYRDSFVKELDAFVSAISGESEVAVSGYDGKMPVAIAMAAQLSLREHRPVKVNEIIG